MQTIIITDGNEKDRRQKVHDLLKNLAVSVFDRLIIEEGIALGIEKIREIQHFLILKSYNSPNRAIIVPNFDKATHQAQNAFLKTLEEPPANTYIILTTTNVDLILPTIVSRSNVITLIGSKEEENGVDFDVLPIIKNLSQQSIGQKILTAETIAKGKKETEDFLSESITQLRQNLINHYIDSSPFNPHDLSPLYQMGLIRKFIKATEFIKKNTNPRLTLEVLFLGI